MSQADHSPELLFTREAAREVDRAAVEEYGMPSIVLMENAARELAAAAMDLLQSAGRNAKRVKPHVVIVCGPGNNGGDGYALARHLHNAGCAITLVPVGEPRDGTDAATNRAICRRMRIAEVTLEDHESTAAPDLLVDAVLGTGLARAVEGDPAEAIRWMNRAGAPILAVDVPSGLDCNTGEPLGLAVRAARTVTFVGIKIGFTRDGAKSFLGTTTVGNIGVPVELVRRLGRAAND